jgi:hypothetical protein
MTFADRFSDLRPRASKSRPSRFSMVLPVAAIGLALAAGLTGQAFGGDVDNRTPTPWTGPVPKAKCGPHDRVETGLQGQLTLAERQSGASLEPYNCNLELVGQFAGEGAEWQFAWFGDCGYYDTLSSSPQLVHRGTVVVNAADPRNPFASAYLADPAMTEPWESLKVNDRRQLLGGVQAEFGVGKQPGFSLYDISRDCSHPKLLASVNLPDTTIKGHEGDFAPDGRTYYGSDVTTRTVYPIDISDLRNPKLIANFKSTWYAHGLTVNEDGTRLYVAQPGISGSPNGLVIVDVSEVQQRRPNPTVSVVSQLFWKDGSVAQVPKPIRIKGRPFILFTDEAGSAFFNRAAACAQGLPPDGFARLIDISDENNPRETAKLMLEVHDPKNCSATLNDDSTKIFRYDSHYCTVDDPQDARLALCAYFESGIRVFDIHDPYRPREVAYFKPGAVGSASRPGSPLAAITLGHRTFDWSSSNIRFVKAHGERQLWFTSHDNGFQILRFTNLDDREEIAQRGDRDHDD